MLVGQRQLTMALVGQGWSMVEQGRSSSKREEDETKEVCGGKEEGSEGK